MASHRDPREEFPVPRPRSKGILRGVEPHFRRANFGREFRCNSWLIDGSGILVTMHTPKPIRIANIIIVAVALSASAMAAPITLRLDATEAARKIYRAELTIPANPGPFTLFYPKWIPGEHAPTGPITDLAGLKISAGGVTLSRCSRFILPCLRVFPPST